MAWDLEVTDLGESAWLVAAVETEGRNEVSRATLRVTGSKDQAIYAGKQLVRDTLAQRARAAQKETVAVDVATLDALPVPGPSAADLARRRVGLEKTRRILAATEAEVSDLTERLANATRKRDRLVDDIAAEDASITAAGG